MKITIISARKSKNHKITVIFAQKCIKAAFDDQIYRTICLTTWTIDNEFY